MFQHDYSRAFSDTGLGPELMPLDATETGARVIVEQRKKSEGFHHLAGSLIVHLAISHTVKKGETAVAGQHSVSNMAGALSYSRLSSPKEHFWVGGPEVGRVR